MLQALREVAVNPGETIGRVDSLSYGMLIPWFEPERAQALLGTLEAPVRGALPHRQAALGLTAAVPEPGPGRGRFPWPTLTAQSRVIRRTEASDEALRERCGWLRSVAALGR